MQVPDRQLFTNMRFRIEVEGMERTGAVEAILPDARIVIGPRKRFTTQYGTLTLRRGLTHASEWYDWWNRARTSTRAIEREVLVVLLNERGTDAIRLDLHRGNTGRVSRVEPQRTRQRAADRIAGATRRRIRGLF
jgi:hypothetical protein